MKKRLIILLFVFAGNKCFCQAQELEQLALDIEKLAQFKKILSDLKTAYQILEGGYNSIRDLSEGNFNLHKTFLDGLLAVSPTVRKYKKIGDIINLQIELVKVSKSAKAHFSSSKSFSVDEFNYISSVYENLVTGSLKDLDALLNIVTANKLRMSDDERLKGIDKVYDSMNDKINFLRHFNSGTSILGIQRAKELNDVNSVKQLYNLK